MKKLSKKWKIFITAIIVLVGGLYGVYKVNNRNAFEEMFNSYYNFVPTTALYNMPQIEPIPRDERGKDIVKLHYKENNNTNEIKFSLVNFNENKEIMLIESILIEEGIYLDINYIYNMSTHKLENSVTFHGENVPRVDDDQKQTRELLEKYNISKEYLQEKSDKLLDTVLTDWKNYSGSSYSKDNMGKLTIEKDEFLK
ncbi:TipC family immunity protein [Gemella sanguinis]|uniref:TipC family immunity protein n=1 Tax=Gemella sanguinis TaxID=84135 RepID=UPI00352D054A